MGRKKGAGKELRRLGVRSRKAPACVTSAVHDIHGVHYSDLSSVTVKDLYVSSTKLGPIICPVNGTDSPDLGDGGEGSVLVEAEKTI